MGQLHGCSEERQKGGLTVANGPHYQAGNYVGEIMQQGLSKARTGNSQFVIRVKVLGTPNGEQSYDRDPFQYERIIFMTITQNTINFVSETLEALGYSGQGFGPLDPSHPQHQSFVGQQVDLYCTHEADQSGNMREKWRISRNGGSNLELNPLNQKELRELDALFGKNLRGTQTSAAPARTAPAQRSAPSVATEITDDDIPF